MVFSGGGPKLRGRRCFGSCLAGKEGGVAGYLARMYPGRPCPQSPDGTQVTSGPRRGTMFVAAGGQRTPPLLAVVQAFLSKLYFPVPDALQKLEADTHQIPFFSAQVRLCWWPQRAATPPSALSWKVGTSHSPKELSTLYHTYLQWTSLAHCNARPLGWESGLQCWGRREWQLWSAIVANPRPPSAASTKPAIVRAPKKQKAVFFFLRVLGNTNP